MAVQLTCTTCTACTARSNSSVTRGWASRPYDTRTMLLPLLPALLPTALLLPLSPIVLLPWSAVTMVPVYCAHVVGVLPGVTAALAWEVVEGAVTPAVTAGHGDGMAVARQCGTMPCSDTSALLPPPGGSHL